MSDEVPSATRRGARALRRLLALAVAGLTLATLAVPATASAADSIYWGDGAAGAIRVGNLDGSGSASNLFTGEDAPLGVAVDPAANKVYWADGSSGAIRVGNLDGSGSASTLFTGEQGPIGIAIDPGANKIYWAATVSGAIRVGNLDGSGSPSSLFTDETEPSGVAIDPAANEIYWGSTSGAIRVGNLDGSGSPSSLYTGSFFPFGIAIDPAANKIYWDDGTSPGGIWTGNLDGSGSPSSLFTGEDEPQGVAIDSTANKVYWAANGSGEIRVGNLDGSGSPSSLFSGEAGAAFPVLLHPPAGSGAPQVSGGNQVGEELSCSEGSWAPDLLGAFLYQAPGSFAYQWQLNGSEVSGADQSTFTPTEPGSYTCTVAASNQAGSSSAQTSDPRQVDPLPPSCDAVPVTVSQDTPTEISLQCSGQGTLTYELVTQPFDGEVSDFDPSAGTLTYTPNSGFTGNDGFGYRASNAGGPSDVATVSIGVSAPPPPPPPPPPPAPPSNQFGLGKLVRDAKRGTAKLTLTVPGPGALRLATTKRVGPQRKRASAAGSVKLTVRSRGKARERLRRRGSVTVRVMVTFTPDGGTPNTQGKVLKLKLERR